MDVSRFHCAAFLCLWGICLPAQDQPTFRASTRLVQVNVVVHDKKGAPVADLRKENFTLLDRGRGRKVAVFTVDSAPAAWPVLPPNIFSNRILRPGTLPHITVILFDVLNTQITDQVYAKRQILNFLGSLRPEDRVAIYLLARDVRVLHDFTNESDHLIKALAKYRGRHSSEQAAAEPEAVMPSGSDELDAFLENAHQVVSDFYNVERAQVTLKSMEAIARHLASLPGRKNLIWVSSSFPFTLGLSERSAGIPSPDHRTFDEETRRLGRVMNDSNVAIYPVDARGLVTGMPEMSASVATRPGTPPRPLLIPAPNHDTMQILAERTGGRAYFNTNDLTEAIRQAVDDARLTYTLGFYPPDEDWDEKFHEIKIKVDRAGVDVRYRKGFMALSLQPPTQEKISALMKSALASAVDAGGIGLNARTDIIDKPKPGTLYLTLQIDPENFVLEQRQDRWVGAVDILFAQRGPDGTVLDAIKQTLNMDLTKERYAGIMQRSLQVEKSIQPVDTAEQLRVVVVDHATGNIGSLQIPIKR